MTYELPSSEHPDTCHSGAVLASAWYVNTDRLWNLDLSVKELRGRDYSKANSTLENHGESRRSALVFSASRMLTLYQLGSGVIAKRPDPHKPLDSTVGVQPRHETFLVEPNHAGPYSYILPCWLQLLF